LHHTPNLRASRRQSQRQHLRLRCQFQRLHQHHRRQCQPQRQSLRRHQWPQRPVVQRGRSYWPEVQVLTAAAAAVPAAPAVPNRVLLFTPPRLLPLRGGLDLDRLLLCPLPEVRVLLLMSLLLLPLPVLRLMLAPRTPRLGPFFLFVCRLIPLLVLVLALASLVLQA
jgi:hypothetical protein